MEKNYSADIVKSDEATVKLAIKALLEVVQGKSLEVAIMKKGERMKMLEQTELDRVVTEIEKEKDEEAEKKKAKKWI